jgi:phage terminase large subunit
MKRVRVVEMTTPSKWRVTTLKARSLNLTYWWIEEASEVGYDYFVQLQTRLRNHATEHHRGILSTNPDLG